VMLRWRFADKLCDHPQRTQRSTKRLKTRCVCIPPCFFVDAVTAGPSALYSRSGNNDHPGCSTG
jgi:hypothetical protein